MHISLTGINYRTAPITIREKAAVTADALADNLSLLHSCTGNGVIVSTCNRTEVYTTGNSVEHTRKAAIAFFKAYMGIDDLELSRHLYSHHDREVVEHIFRVASGLDSMVVGEFEVLGQVSHALQAAETAEMANLSLRHLFQSAIRAGRRVRDETAISRNPVSVSSVAVDLASKIVSDLRTSRMLVVGTGEAGRLVVKVARERGVSEIFVASRSKERASALTERFGGTPVAFSNLKDVLYRTDMVVYCAGAPHSILDISHIQEAMASRPDLPLVIIDIAVPRGIAPEVKNLNNIYLYNIDDLNGICSVNRAQRESEIHRAAAIVNEEVGIFLSWLTTLETRPVVSALMSKAERIRAMQLDQTLKKLRTLSEEEQENLTAMTKSIVTKILKDPIESLKNGNGKGQDAEIIARMFQLQRELTD